MTSPCITVLNCGSSSVKFQIFSYSKPLDLLAHGQIINLGTNPSFHATHTLTPEKNRNKTLNKHCGYEQAIHQIIRWVEKNEQWHIHAVAHRVVHGGTAFNKSILITPDALLRLKEFNTLAPLHQPHHLAAIEIMSHLYPQIHQIACFDTAFHLNHEPLFTEYALPLHLRKKGIRRYGFHGLSFEWVAHVLQKEHPELAKSRLVIAHLGNGASLCAMNHGVSIDTTMGLTALDGLPMGTRCGHLDPGAVLYMIQHLGLSPEQVEHLLYQESGLLGLSGISNDVKELEQCADQKAQFALDFFCMKTAQHIGMMAIAIGGLDGIILTGGIGEHSEWIRSQILNKIQCLQPFTALVIPANEEKMMAMHALSTLEHTKPIKGKKNE